MQLEDIKFFIAGAEPLTTIQAAISKAGNAPGGAVIIPANYTGTDTYTNASNLPILDMRGSATSTGINIPSTVSATVLKATSSIAGVMQAISATAAAPITAAAGGTFVTTLNIPGATLEQVPFYVRACGYVSLGAGTYTATVQPLLYASTTVGFTAAAANAVYSTAAVNATISSASAKVIPWMASVQMWGDSTSGLTVGLKSGGMNNGAQQVQAPAAMDNPLSSVNFAAATPIQFACGVTLTNSAATSVINLGSLILEA